LGRAKEEEEDSTENDEKKIWRNGGIKMGEGE
jgi:hypothetical protein